MTFLARSSSPDFAVSGTQGKTGADEPEQRQIPGATADHQPEWPRTISTLYCGDCRLLLAAAGGLDTQ